jgi:uncharacterized membrane protein/predicted DsbA family dithiol-disulfide isomerase
MSRAILNKITLALAFVGCIIALVLTYEHFFPAADIGCGAVGGNCHNTIESKYGKLGPIPTSVLGFGMYLTLAGICVVRARSLSGRNAPGPDEKPLGIALFGISLLAFCISWWLQYTAIFVLVTFCPWCFASALTVTAIFLVNSYDHLILGRALTGEQRMLTGVVAFIGVMLGILYGPQILFQFRLATRGPGGDPGVHVPISDRNAPLVHPREQLLSKGLIFKGKPTATYTIIEFADYGCSHCRDASADMDAFIKKYPDRYRLAFRNFPLGRWPYSAMEAAAAEAAGLQGKFWEMHDILFAHQPEIDTETFNPDSIVKWAESLGLDMARLKKDMQASKMREKVAHDHYIGEVNNVTLTPSFFVIPSDPNQKVMMITGGDDAKLVMGNPADPFWQGNPRSLKNPEPPKKPTL